MGVMMTVGVHRTPHQMPRHWKKFEKSSEADEAPGQGVAGRSGADNPWSSGGRCGHRIEDAPECAPQMLHEA